MDYLAEDFLWALDVEWYTLIGVLVDSPLNDTDTIEYGYTKNTYMTA